MGGFDDLKSLPVILLLTGVFFAIAMIIMASFQSTTVTTLTVVNESVLTPPVNGTVTLSHYRIVSIISLVNGTGKDFEARNLTITNYENSTVQYLYNVSTCQTGKYCNMTYTYNTYDTTVPSAIQKIVVAQSEIPSNWLLLIATVIAAAILIGFVMKELPMSGRQ